MKKKLFSLLMAVAMVLSLAVPAFADDYWEFKNTAESTSTAPKVEVKGKFFVPTIKLFVPNLTGENHMILNPYRIEYTSSIASATSVWSGGNDHISQLICPIYAVRSETPAKLNVKAAANATVQGTGFSLANDHISFSETGKKGFFQLVIKKQSVASSPSDLGYINTSSAMGKLDAYDTANNSVIKLSANAPTGTNIPKVATIGIATDSAPQYMLFQVDGEMTRSPTPDSWASGDKLTVTSTFTFTPVSAPDAVATVDNTVFTDTLSRDPITTESKTINLPLMSSGSLDKKNFATFKEYWTGDGAPDISAVNASDPKWEIIDDAGLGFTCAGTSGEYALTFGPTVLEGLPKDGTAHPYTFTLGYLDKNSVPRSVEVTVTITRQA